jgi:hypothetical protein
MDSSKEVLLQVIPIKIINPDGKMVTTYGLIDSGSDVTLIDQSLVEQLQFKGQPDRLRFSTIDSNDIQEAGVKVEFKMGAVDNDDDDMIDVQNAWSIKDLNIPLKHQVIHRNVGRPVAPFAACTIP